MGKNQGKKYFQNAVDRRDRSQITPFLFLEMYNDLIHPQIKYHDHIAIPLCQNPKKQQKKTNVDMWRPR